jgi:hypothetical protein
MSVFMPVRGRMLQYLTTGRAAKYRTGQWEIRSKVSAMAVLYVKPKFLLKRGLFTYLRGGGN